ncbi:hypothetical protein [Desulfocastanea catecholica]
MHRLWLLPISGLSWGKGTEVALETADIALMGDDTGKLPFLISLGRRMLFNIKLNIVFSLVFNLVAVLAGASGMITPIMAKVVHKIGSVMVVLSSASIGFFKEDSSGGILNLNYFRIQTKLNPKF